MCVAHKRSWSDRYCDQREFSVMVMMWKMRYFPRQYYVCHKVKGSSKSKQKGSQSDFDTEKGQSTR